MDVYAALLLPLERAGGDAAAEEAHLTLVWAGGTTAEHADQIATDLHQLWMTLHNSEFQFTGEVEMFGDNNDVPVYPVQVLSAETEQALREFHARHLRNSPHLEFRPHVTVANRAVRRALEPLVGRPWRPRAAYVKVKGEPRALYKVETQ